MNTPNYLTPNRRLARFLHQQEGQKFQSWSDWLQEIWTTDYEMIVAEQPLVCLSDWQSILLWQEIIQACHKDPLFNLAQAVTHARQAWSLSVNWCSDPQTWAGEKPETEAFIQWLKAYEERCATQGWIDSTVLPLKLYAYWEAHPEQAPREIHLRGFDELSPLQKSILALWENQGALVQIEPTPDSIHPYTYLAFNDRQSQLTQAALYAKEALNSNPNLPIGIIIPAIQDDWANIQKTFSEILGPEQPFNISAGQPLAQTPIIYAALQCLSPQSIFYLLKTPYLRGGLSEQSGRAICDLKLSHYQKELSIQFVRQHCELPMIFKEVLDEALDSIAKVNQQDKFPSEWIAELFKILTAWGWPGDRTLSSEAYQAVTHFYRLINELASLDEVLGPVSYLQIMKVLSQRLHQTMFQPESQDKPIQVLGFLEAAGLSFSYLWVMDLGADTWPEKPAPNPFIPIQIQIELGIPHASFARELHFAQTMTQRMLSSSPEIIMSYAMHGEGGEAMSLPSPLLKETPLASSLWGERDHKTLPEQLYALKTVDPLPDPEGLPLKQAQSKGGSAIFKDQAACPFRAYAKHRLKANQPEEIQFGLSSSQKGSLIHEIMEEIWGKLKNTEALVNLGENGLDELIDRTTSQALARLLPPLSTVEQDLEYQRLMPLLKEWFALELERSPMEIISLEKNQAIDFEGLSLHLRADRIDRAQGVLTIVDYKTGAVDIKSWEDERPDEPQLPLYACVNQPPPQALAFAQLRKNDLAWKTLGPMEPEAWSEQLDAWRQALSLLAQEFKSGFAQVHPKNGSQTCQFCDLQNFCRINHDQ